MSSAPSSPVGLFSPLAAVRRWLRRPSATPTTPTLTAGQQAALYGAASRTLRQRQALYQRLSRRQQPRARADLKRWREAIGAWQHPHRPNPRPLLQLMEDVLLDAHLAALVHTRRLRVTGVPLQLIGPTGTPDPAAEAALTGPWLRQALSSVFDASLYGYSLVELTPDAQLPGGLRAHTIARAHVLPQPGLICLDGGAVPPTLDPADPPSTDALADAGWWRLSELQPHALALIAPDDQPGLLMQAVPYVVMKRHAMACWSEFAEVFGMPMRVARTPAHDPARKQQLAELLKTMGSAAYVVLDEGEQIELKDNARADAYRVYDRLVERCNQELSKLLHGQTLTTEAGDRGARSLGEIHDRIFDDITRADIDRVERSFNAHIMPLLAQFEHTAAYRQHRLRIDRNAAVLSLAEQWQVDQGLLDHFAIDPAYFTRKYGVPIVGVREASAATAQP